MAIFKQYNSLSGLLNITVISLYCFVTILKAYEQEPYRLSLHIAMCRLYTTERNKLHSHLLSGSQTKKALLKDSKPVFLSRCINKGL